MAAEHAKRRLAVAIVGNMIVVLAIMKITTVITITIDVIIRISIR